MDNNVYEFILKNETTEQKAVAGQKGTSDTKVANSAKDDLKLGALGLTCYRKVKAVASQIINYEVSMVELRTGSRELQERANFTHSVIQKGWGLLESTAIGAATGGLVGVAVADALWATQTAIGYAQAQNTINEKRSLENIGIQMTSTRAGVNGSRK